MAGRRETRRNVTYHKRTDTTPPNARHIPSIHPSLHPSTHPIASLPRIALGSGAFFSHLRTTLTSALSTHTHTRARSLTHTQQPL